MLVGDGPLPTGPGPLVEDGVTTVAAGADEAMPGRTDAAGEALQEAARTATAATTTKRGWNIRRSIRRGLSGVDVPRVLRWRDVIASPHRSPCSRPLGARRGLLEFAFRSAIACGRLAGPPVAGCPIASPGIITRPTESEAPSQRIAASTLGFALPVPVSRSVAFVKCQSIILAGGLSSKGSVRTVLSIDPSTGHEVQAGQLAVAVHDAAGAVSGDRQLVFGGGNVTPVRTVQRLSGATGTVAGTLPKARADLAAVTVGAAAIVIGGGTPAQLDRTILSTSDGASFRSIGLLSVGTRYPAVAVVANLVLVVGGSDGSHDLDVIQALDPLSGTVRVIGRLPHGLSHASAFVLAGRLFVAGGRWGGKAQDAIWEIDLETGTASVRGRLPAAISDSAAVVLDGVAYMLGGETDAFQASIVTIRLA
jgi:hypothetical protein